MLLKDAAKLRAYGASYGAQREEPTRCIASVTATGSWHSTQCARKRGFGDDGLWCKQHATKGGRAPSEGSWGRNLLAMLERERKPLVDAVAKLADLDSKIAVLTEALEVK